ncbi:MAG: helix-turn-helix transcriptional regulator [Thaumarchaeota archaeon]|nr:helix-turn-helix transcriptional regulator [Nitrososphaerota archaeon]
MEGEDFLKSLEDYENLEACPIALGFRILGKRWTIEIVRQLFLGDSKFNELQKNAPGINPRMLSLRLKELEKLGLLRRTVLDETPVLITYDLTELGMDIIPVMYSMAKFSMKNFPKEVFVDGRSRTHEQVTGEITSSVRGVKPYTRP